MSFGVDRTLAEATPNMTALAERGSLYVKGMRGIGDSIHQRAVVKQLIRRNLIWLETPWPCLYFDLAGPNLRFVAKQTKLRFQSKNMERERGAFVNQAGAFQCRVRVSYSHASIRRCGSVLGAMLNDCGCDPDAFHFGFPALPETWTTKAHDVLDRIKPRGSKPLMILRPLSERTSWSGSRVRNPDTAAFAALYHALRESFFVVSAADWQEGQEWQVGETLPADATFHNGELDIETLIALTRLASLSYSAPGSAIIIAQAVGTPSIGVFGGFENGKSFSLGARFTPHLAVEPITPCDCFSTDHDCNTTIDVEAAIPRVREWTDKTLKVRRVFP